MTYSSFVGNGDFTVGLLDPIVFDDDSSKKQSEMAVSLFTIFMMEKKITVEEG